MGTYLNKPMKEKETEEGGNARLEYAATSMQGWRAKQEDAHNCILDFRHKCSLFSVFDGHGGSEVAQYAAMHLPNFLKENKSWIKCDYETLLTGAFLDFDARLRSDEVIKELKLLSGSAENVNEGDVSDDEDRAALYEEAYQPLQSILTKYGLTFYEKQNGQVAWGEIEALRKKQDDEIMERINKASDNKPRKDDANKNGEHLNKKEEPKIHKIVEKNELDCNDIKENGIDEKVMDSEGDSKKSSDLSIPFSNIDCKDSSQDDEISEEVRDPRKRTAQSLGHKIDNQKRAKLGEESRSIVQVDEGQTSSVGSMINELQSLKNIDKPAVNSSDSEESYDEDYKDETSEDEQKDEEDDECNGSEDNASADDEDVDEDAGDDNEDADDEDGEDDNDGDHVENDAKVRISDSASDVPGEDSGTTACLVLIMEDRIIVGNVGDSRAVLCRNGIAVDLSIDHKPEDEKERRRIEEAGGEVGLDGRVNGGLNLSRALGDHFYKKNQALLLQDQMISPSPDVTENLIESDDEFIIVACDGIWNSLSSQQGVDFVRSRLKKGMKLSEITELICDECLSPDTTGDGTGCDNMTIIIVQFKQSHLEPA